jgi:hypothetical protein
MSTMQLRTMVWLPVANIPDGSGNSSHVLPAPIGLVLP